MPNSRSQSLPKSALALVRVVGQLPLFFGEIKEKAVAPADITCLALPEIIAEKIRECYQRNKARDIYDLGAFAARPLDQTLIRRLE